MCTSYCHLRKVIPGTFSLSHFRRTALRLISELFSPQLLAELSRAASVVAARLSSRRSGRGGRTEKVVDDDGGVPTAGKTQWGGSLEPSTAHPARSWWAKTGHALTAPARERPRHGARHVNDPATAPARERPRHGART